jgi:hypothetical protein
MMEEAPSRFPSYPRTGGLHALLHPADTRFYAGIDLHARSLFLCVLDRDGQQRLARDLTAAPAPFLQAVAPFRDGLVVGCECMHCWYWLADACRAANIAFVLGHAWGMKAVHGSKTKCDRHDAEAIARLLRGGNFPLAYAYPKERRGLRDLLRARLRLVRQRAELYGHVHTARRQANLPPASSDVKYKSKRAAITADIADPFVRRRVETHLGLLGSNGGTTSTSPQVARGDRPRNAKKRRRASSAVADARQRQRQQEQRRAEGVGQQVGGGSHLRLPSNS